MSTSTLSITNHNTSVPGLIVICGATATGKTKLAIAIAERLNSAILSADSRQIYREFNIGTAKPTLTERQAVPHYLIDICDPTEILTLAEYQQQAQDLIEGRRNDNAGQGDEGVCEWRGLDSGSEAPLLLVGGTGLYIKSIVKGMKIPRVPPQPELRSQLQSLGQRYCYACLQQVDPRAADRIHPHDQTRTLRALEVFYTTGYPMSEQQGEAPPNYPILQIGLDCQDTDALRHRIAYRTRLMVSEGFVAEVASLGQKYGWDLPLLNTLGYAEFKQHLVGDISLLEAQKQTVLHTRQFAKRQRTWFHAYPEIEWFDCDRPDLLEVVWQRISLFLQQNNLIRLPY
ncbi:MAG TPA: tRNA (adenosine(37)-N6)-dimethylallyltransferase MiaA [Microcoleaceae cyanobacterium]|jgi:tRNA dimethylallyltransferase